MRRIAAAVCCMLWLCYGSLAGLAHVHEDSTPDHLHGLGLDHVHDASGQEPVEQDHDFGLTSAGPASGAHYEGPIYLTANAVKSQARAVLAPIDLAGETLAAPPARSEAGHLDFNQQPRDPPSKVLPGLRAPPA